MSSKQMTKIIKGLKENIGEHIYILLEWREPKQEEKINLIQKEEIFKKRERIHKKI